jgi:hypothetical protein
MFTFLHQTDKFIITGDMAAQTFWQWSDDIKPEDDITPFDGTGFDIIQVLSSRTTAVISQHLDLTIKYVDWTVKK